MLKYKVVASMIIDKGPTEVAADLEYKVNQAIKQGWTPHGGLSMGVTLRGNIFAFQAMSRDEEGK